MASFVERPRSACALAGALSTISALPRVIPVIHSSIGCGGNLSGATAFGSGYFGSGYCSGASAPTSAITETEIVFGGAERLEEEIAATLELIDGDLYIVATGCMTEMIGDDVQGVVSEFSVEGKPVLAVSTPSFKGDSYAGYEIVLDGIFNRYLPPEAEAESGLVNLFGVLPAYDPFFRGDLEELKRLLERLGLRVNTFFTPDQSFENILSAPKASLNIQLSRVWGTEFVERFEERHGTPYWVTDLPVGAEATDRFLRKLGDSLHLDAALVEQVVEEENRTYYSYLERTADVFCDSDYKYYAITVTNSNYAIPAASFVQRELGWVQLDAFVTDQIHEEQRETLAAAWHSAALEGELYFETDASQIAKALTQRHPQNRGERYFDGCSPLYILGSTLEKPTALARGATHLSISYPLYNRIVLDRGYAGYRGGLHLFEDLVGALVAPKQ